MNDFDEFFEISGAIFLAIVLLMIVLTYLEGTLFSFQDRPPKDESDELRARGVLPAWLRRRRR